MRLGKSSIAGASLLVLALQLVIVSSIAGKYLYQRWTCPRVWTRTTSYDPSLPLRGRYLSVQLMVDGCVSTLPSAAQAAIPRDENGVQAGQIYTVHGPDAVNFAARLEVKDRKLEAIRILDAQETSGGQQVMAGPGTPCDRMMLATPVDFFIAEHAASPAAVQRGQELWMEVTVPPKGPPRPIQLALKDSDGAWKPLAFQ
jgi:hypothetical protein